MSAAESSGIAFPARIRLAHQPMNEAEAVEATNRVNTYAKRLPQCVKEVHDGQAWLALGCASWDEYVAEHLVITIRYANMLLAAATRLHELADQFDVDLELLAVPERVLRGADLGTMVPEIEANIAELGPDPEPEAKAAAVTEGIRSAAVEAARLRREREAAEAAEREAAAFARGAAQANEGTMVPESAEPEGSTAPAPPVPDPAPHAPQAASPAGLSDAREADVEAPAAPTSVADEPGRAAPVPAVTTPIGWDWDLILNLSTETAVALITDPDEIGFLDDVADWLHRFFAARKEMAA